MMELPATRYAATADGLSIAFQEWGDGETTLVWVPGAASHLELGWEIPSLVHLYRRLGSHYRTVTFDKRGTGLSDRTMGTGTLESRASDIEAVLDAADVQRAVVVGVSEGAAMAMMFAALHPDRVERLVMLAAVVQSNSEASERFAAEVEAVWGTGVVTQAVWFKGAGDERLAELGRFERAMATPRAMADLFRHNASLDARPLAPQLCMPTCVIHVRGDPVVPFANAEWLAANLPDAVLVEIEGDYHGPAGLVELDRMLDPLIEFASAGGPAPSRPSDRELAAVLFTDVVDSTRQAGDLGDERWVRQLEALEHITEATVRRHHGRWVKSTGDGTLATFPGPAAAVHAGLEVCDQARELELTLRAGVHFGEIEWRGDDIGGIAVNLAARVMNAAGDGELWVSPTVPGLTIGSNIRFEARGHHELKGLDGQWPLSAAAH
jgi:pimeloyl-ACP methyl ester carboxylesterase/class 3 adenylate cyclase